MTDREAAVRWAERVQRTLKEYPDSYDSEYIAASNFILSTPPATDEAALSKFIDRVWNTAVDKSFHAQSGIYQQKVYDALKAELRSMLAEGESERDELRRALGEYGHHKMGCNAFPATSDEQIARDCDCGLQAALVARHAAGEGK